MGASSLNQLAGWMVLGGRIGLANLEVSVRWRPHTAAAATGLRKAGGPPGLPGPLFTRPRARPWQSGGALRGGESEIAPSKRLRRRSDARRNPPRLSSLCPLRRRANARMSEERGGRSLSRFGACGYLLPERSSSSCPCSSTTCTRSPRETRSHSRQKDRGRRDRLSRYCGPGS